MGSGLAVFHVGTTLAYTLAAVAHLMLFYRRWDRLTRELTRCAWILHTGALALLVLRTGRFPAYTIPEAAVFLTWLLVGLYLVYDWRSRNLGAGVFLLPVIFLLLVAGAGLPRAVPASAPGPAPPVPVAIVAGHALVALFALGCSVGAFVAGAMYLLLEWQLRRKAMGPLSYRLPSLEGLDLWGHRCVAAGFTLLTLAMVSGSLFAGRLWGHAGWALDAKLLWTLLTWGLYAGYLAVRRYRGWGGRQAAWWSILGFLSAAANYLVINRFASDWHRFDL